MGLIGWLIIGGLAGWIAGHVMRGGGFGLFGNIGVGILGAVIGGFLFGLLGLQAGSVIGSLITAVIGAVVLLWGINMLRRD
ncbi:GlsB/YeaQ/YmgE family stress response membrane protein [Halomonas sp. H5]|uniref:GlsB/YeaQ/YmgE family stress response membrane protein n=1 Tax=Halomonas sp. H5 TaxID=3423910 RepID=UPI003D366CFF